MTSVMDATAPVSIEKRTLSQLLEPISKSLVRTIGSLLLLGILDISASAQSIVSPTQPLRLMPPKPLNSASQGQWNRLPQEGIVLDSGSSEAFDAADPASPFQSPSSQASRFGTKIPRGLPDVSPSERSSLRSELVSESNSVSDPESDDIEMIGDEQDDGNKNKKAARQRNEQQRRLVATFPRDFLLDSSDPGLFQFLSDQWVPSRFSEGKESRSRIERAADAAWQELRPELLSKLQSCDSLLRKNSVHSARDEIRNGLTLLARKLDQLSGPAGEPTPRRSSIRRSMPHESALQHALREIDECNYSTPDQITQSLQTFSDLVPQAILNHPWAADLLYALGKTYERELEFAPKQQEVLREQSLGAYQAAVKIAPSRGYIANQLGYNFLHVGSLDEAAKALRQAIDAGPTPYAWRNLAELYRRRGLVREAQLADEQAEFLLSGEKPTP